MICSKIIPTIAAAAKKSNTNKDKKTVCMVGCLYSLRRARALSFLGNLLQVLTSSHYY